MAGIVLSYRGAEGEWADRLSRHLANRFGNDLVCYDLDEIGSGEKWHDKIADAEVALVVIGPSLSAHESGGFRSHVAAALGLDKPVIPVLVGGADVATSVDINAANLRDAEWSDDLSRLLERVRDILRPIRGREQLYNVQLEACGLQERFAEALKKDPAEAVDVAHQVLALLDRVSPLFPADNILLASRGYTHKNLATALRRLGRDEEADGHLASADKVFITLREEFPMEPAAWDGKGSVEFMRGNLEEARSCFERALRLNPTYEDAVQNLDKVLAEIEKEGGKV